MIQLTEINYYPIKSCGGRPLASYRRQDSKVLFGQNLIHASEGRIRRGDVVEVLNSSL